MSITSVKEIWQGRDGEASSSPAAILYSRVFRVRTDDRFTEAFSIMSSASIPQIGSTYPNDIRATCRRVRPTNEGFSPYIWIVHCSYSTEQSTQPSDNPLNDPVRITWGTESYSNVLMEDRDGNAIVNSAGDPFHEGGVEEQEEYAVARITKNVSSVPSWIWQYRRSTNNSGITIDGLSVGTEVARMRRISLSDVQIRNDIAFRVFGMEIALNEDKWTHKVLDRGFNELHPATGDRKKRRIKNAADMTDVTSPVLLNGSGTKLVNPETATPVFLEFETLFPMDYSVLPGIS
jgi:hypothetical protein